MERAGYLGVQALDVELAGVLGVTGERETRGGEGPSGEVLGWEGSRDARPTGRDRAVRGGRGKQLGQTGQLAR